MPDNVLSTLLTLQALGTTVPILEKQLIGTFADVQELVAD
jgi:hypothetical protein